MTQTPRPPTHLPPAMPEDSLVASYRAAIAELERSDSAQPAGPSPQVRANIHAYAQQLAEARAETSNAPHSVAARADNHSASSTSEAEKPAANDSQWKIRALASVAIFGLTGLLLMQWSNAPPDERDVAFSAARPAPPAAVGKSDKAEAAAAATPVSPPAAAPAPAPAIAAVPTSPTAENKTEQAPVSAQTRSNADEIRAEATTGAPNSAKKIKREAARSDSEASATATHPSVADSAKDKAESITRSAPAPQPTPLPASPPSAAPAPAPAPAVAADSAAASKPDAAMAQSGAVGSAPAAMAKATPPAAATAPLAEAYTAPRPAAAAAPSAPAPAVAARARSSANEESTSSSVAQSAPQGGLQRQATPPSPNTALFTAIRNKDAAALQQALNDGADKNTKRNGTPAITLCVQAGQADMVQLLVNAAADVNAVDTQGITPLAHARERGLAQIVRILLKAGAQ